MESMSVILKVKYFYKTEKRGSIMSNNNLSDAEMEDFIKITSEAAAEEKIRENGVSYIKCDSFTEKCNKINEKFQEKAEHFEELLDKSKKIHNNFIEIKAGTEKITNSKDFTEVITGMTTVVGSVKVLAKDMKEFIPQTHAFLKDFMPKSIPQASVTTELAEQAIGFNPKGIGGGLSDIGSGAIAGVIVGVGISAWENYDLYKKGFITRDELKSRILSDGIYGGSVGATTSGALFAISSSTQIAIGLSNPVTIPVMIFVGWGVEKILAPAFKRGIYKEVLIELKSSHDFEIALMNYMKNAVLSYSVMVEFLKQNRELDLKLYSELDNFEKKSIEKNKDIKSIIAEINKLGE